jgi:hypothetical protein
VVQSDLGEGAWTEGWTVAAFADAYDVAARLVPLAVLDTRMIRASAFLVLVFDVLAGTVIELDSNSPVGMAGFLLPTPPVMPWLHYNWPEEADSSLVVVIGLDVVAAAADTAAADTAAVAGGAGELPCFDYILLLEEEVDDLT